MPSGQEPTAERAAALIGCGGVAWWRQDRTTAGACYGEAVDIERRLGDARRIAEALYNLSFVVAGEDIDRASDLLHECLDLFRQAGDERGIAQVLAMLVIGDAREGRWERVVTSLDETVAIWRRLGDRLHLAFDLLWLSFAHGRLRHVPEAWAFGLESMELFRGAGNTTGVGIAFSNLAFLATWSGHHREALVLAGAAETVRAKVGGPPGGFAGILDTDPADEARSHVDPDDAERAFAEGLEMSTDQAVGVAHGLAGSSA